MYRTLSGKEPAEAVLINVKRRVIALHKKPHLAIVFVGNSPESEIYVKNKLVKAEYSAIKTSLHRLPESVSEKELLALVDKLNEDPDVAGFIVQAPLPKHINHDRVMDAIAAEKDVDGWTTANLGKLLAGEEDGFLPATPAGVMRMLEYYDVELEGKHAVVIGRSNVVGKPVALLLLQKNATVTICHSKTSNLAAFTREADILVVAVGKPGLITGDMVKKGAVVIDVGINKTEKGLVGDVKFDEVIKKADCAPVPGGIGLLTVAMLLDNTVKAAEMNAKKDAKKNTKKEE
jgi:methylenetetrahydrofolate dehydrogenase (NADP+)/methenyltetrahydrofolate cyclohydrolase